ncbi:1419_t:CDS:2, partial [Dentiscutata heterogama]
SKHFQKRTTNDIRLYNMSRSPVTSTIIDSPPLQSRLNSHHYCMLLFERIKSSVYQ